MASNETHYVLDRPSFDKPVKVLIVVSPITNKLPINWSQGPRPRLRPQGAHGI